jgi:hypothetical protein
MAKSEVKDGMNSTHGTSEGWFIGGHQSENLADSPLCTNGAGRSKENIRSDAKVIHFDKKMLLKDS